MTNFTICKYRDISERDMDMLFIEAFATDPEFPALFINKTELAGKPCKIVCAERSKIDYGLGESDITIIVGVDGEKNALLIEDKIDAPAMRDQHKRYLERGEKGLKEGNYSHYYVLIVCPKQYRETNKEAQKYEYFVSYEECQQYFSEKNDIYNQLRYQKITQALETRKPEYKTTINKIAVESFKKYREYQEHHYPRLHPQNKIERNTVNGWWPSYKVNAKGMYILHKTDEKHNCVDLTINGAANRINELEVILKWLHDAGHENITLEKTGRSAAFRIKTPEIKMSTEFEHWNMEDLKECFDAIQELSDLATMFGFINKVLFQSSTDDKAT